MCLTRLRAVAPGPPGAQPRFLGIIGLMLLAVGFASWNHTACDELWWVAWRTTNLFCVIYIYCETWMRLCQAHCQENKRKVPESPLLTAHRSQRGADCVCNTLVPETGPPFWKPFLLPEILRPRFWGRFLAPFLGPRKRKQELLDGP